MDESPRQSTASARQNYSNTFAQVSDLTVEFGDSRKTKWLFESSSCLSWAECVSTLLICCEKHGELVICFL